jgi:hypothetical protein
LKRGIEGDFKILPNPPLKKEGMKDSATAT